MFMQCDCGTKTELPEGFFEGSAVRFFEQHGHFPRLLTLECECGETHSTGLALYECTQEAVNDAWRAAVQWYRDHQDHDSTPIRTMQIAPRAHGSIYAGLWRSLWC